MIDKLLSPQIVNQLIEEITTVVIDTARNIVPSQSSAREQEKIDGYLNKTDAQKFVGSKSLLIKLEKNGLGRYVIDGTIRYKVEDIDEIMDMFKV
ncbi:hypothetical protein [Latilactobacillus sakei]|uniref:hypothetical protein n=1 Tax=Latilactobacillus sakei TaxID=1599 RepID=UPI0009777EFD|nr:hypothetical protein [Latilactobacillus sakei]